MGTISKFILKTMYKILFIYEVKQSNIFLYDIKKLYLYYLQNVLIDTTSARP